MIQVVPQRNIWLHVGRLQLGDRIGQGFGIGAGGSDNSYSFGLLSDSNESGAD